MYATNDLGKTFQELCDKTLALMKTHKVPGVAVGLIVNGEEFIQGFGVTSLEHPLPVTTETLFQIGSTTKTVTATAIMRLVEQGLLELNKPVKTYVKRFKVKDKFASDNVTVKQLLNHTSGWLGDYFENTGDGDDALAKYTAKMAKLVQLTPLGEVWSYNNSAFSLAGRVIESVTKKPYERVVQELVLEPLGLSNSFFLPAQVMLRRFAVGHATQKLGDEEKGIVAHPWPIPRSSNAAGGLCSSLKDQLRYARFHLGDGRNWKGERVLSKKSMKLMQTPTVSAGFDDFTGLSWFLGTRKGNGKSLSVVAHGGATNGQLSMFWLAPKPQFAFTVLTNADKGGLLNDELNKWVMEHYFGIVQKEPKPLKMPAQKLREYIGVYKDAAFGGLLELKLEEGGLVLHFTPGDYSSFTDVPNTQPPPVKIGVYAKDRLIELDGEGKGNRSEFLRDKQGRIAWLSSGGRIHAKQ
jgi:CubicO group peptidase (beta-lactamase class C family)